MSRAQEMRDLFARWRQSGQSLMAFGKAVGVSYSKLLYWRRKFEREVRAKNDPPGEPTVGFDQLRVAATKEPAVSQPSPFGVWLSNGVSVDVPVGFDEEELLRLIGILSAC